MARPAGLLRASCPPPLRGRLRFAAAFKIVPDNFVTRTIPGARPAGALRFASCVQIGCPADLSNWSEPCRTQQKNGLEGRFLNGAPGRTRTCNPRLSLPLQFSLPCNAGLWSGLSLHPLRCCTYSLYGALRTSTVNLLFFSWIFLGASTLC